MEELNDLPVFYDSCLDFNRFPLASGFLWNQCLLCETATPFQFQHAKQFPPSNLDGYIC